MGPGRRLVLLVLAAIPAACGHDRKMQGVMVAWDGADWQRASAEMQPLLEEHQDAPINGVVYHLDGGTVLRASGDLSGSVKSLDWAYGAVRPYLDEAAETKVTEEAAAVVTNQTVRTYRGTTYDRILLNTYQALNFMQLGQGERARVELNRALNWQQDATQRNADRIAREQAAYEEAGKSKGYDASATLKDESFRAAMEQAYGPVWDKRGSTDYEVTFTTYLRAVTQLARGEASAMDQARQSFKQVAGMLGDGLNEPVLADVAMADAATRGQAPPKMVYVLMETGRAPSRKELRIDIPLFIQEVPYVGAAFPLLEFHDGQVTSFSVQGGAAPLNSFTLCDMDAVVKRNFDDQLPLVIVATLVSSASKAVGTYFAQRAAGDYGWAAALGGAIYQVAMNSADLRCWLTLPKQWLAARLPRPDSGTLSVVLGDGQRLDGLALPDAPVSIVYLKSVRSGTRPLHCVFAVPNDG
ncbi:MAG: hypothetical protein EBQ99_09685 [Planctomycetes bacterium]|nr:hypothetical protein [Planctomycetota bacterium]